MYLIADSVTKTFELQYYWRQAASNSFNVSKPHKIQLSKSTDIQTRLLVRTVKHVGMYKELEIERLIA